MSQCLRSTPRSEGELFCPDLDTKARSALQYLQDLAPAQARPALADALSSLDRFKATTGEIVDLSRRDTNLLSLDLSLREKPPLIAACHDQLAALQAALAKEGSKSER